MTRLDIHALEKGNPELAKKIQVMLGPTTPSKFHNVPAAVDGIQFDSRKEATRYAELKLSQRAGEISDLRLQVVFHLDLNGHHICDYIADFVYRDRLGQVIVEDVKSKGTKTRVYQIKKKLMLAVHNIEIQEV